MLSFQVRVMALVMLVAVTATAATAWLTFRLASSQVQAQRAAYEQDVTKVTQAVTDYGLHHGTWSGVASAVAPLASATGQRIVLATQAGTVLTDTGSSQADRQSKALPSQAGMINPHPALVIKDSEADIATAITYLEIDSFRVGVRLAACLSTAGLPVTVVNGPNGVPHFTAGATDGAVAATPEAARRTCQTSTRSSDAERNQDLANVNACTNDSPDRIACLKKVFAERIASLGPETLLLYLGNGDSGGLPAARVVAAAALVIVFAAAGTALFSRRVLRPIGALTTAARALGRGKLDGRVAVQGNDQVAELTRSFNRMAQSLQEGEERQRRLVADVAHELRTPLSNLRGYLEGLTDGVIAPERHIFSSLHDEAVLQQRIVDDLQDLALAEAGVLTYQRTIIELPELLETCRTAHHARAETTHVTLGLKTDGPTYVDADPDRLRQVINNLLTNAIRYTPPGGRVILHCTHTRTAVTVAVADTGSGIAPDDLPHIFDRFWRADPARGRTTGGSGLGLAITRQIVTDHGGTIAAASEVGRGTTITLTLPNVDI